MAILETLVMRSRTVRPVLLPGVYVNTQTPVTVMLNYDVLPFTDPTLLCITKTLPREVQVKLNFSLRELTSERHEAASWKDRSNQFLAR